MFAVTSFISEEERRAFLSHTHDSRALAHTCVYALAEACIDVTRSPLIVPAQ